MDEASHEPTGSERRTPGPAVVGILLASVLAAVLGAELMMRPVRGTRRAAAELAEAEPLERRRPYEVLAVGRYAGQADGAPFELRVWDSTGAHVVAEAVFLKEGSGPPHMERLEGRFDPTTQTLRLESASSALVFDGRRRGRVLEGEIRRAGLEGRPWRVTLP